MDVENKKRIEELEEKLTPGFQCDFYDCCEYGKYNQCNNHNYLLCPNYEVYANALRDKRNKQ